MLFYIVIAVTLTGVIIAYKKTLNGLDSLQVDKHIAGTARKAATKATPDSVYAYRVWFHEFGKDNPVGYCREKDYENKLIRAAEKFFKLFTGVPNKKKAEDAVLIKIVKEEDKDESLSKLF